MRDVEAEFSMDSAVRETVRALRTIDQPHEMRRIDDAVVEVVVAREDHERWVRVFQRDGLILLGQAPLRREGLVDLAEVVIPADLTDDQLEYEVVDAADMAPPPERPIDRVRAAITAGRDAARADRADIPYQSRPPVGTMRRAVGTRRRSPTRRGGPTTGRGLWRLEGVPTGGRPARRGPGADRPDCPKAPERAASEQFLGTRVSHLGRDRLVPSVAAITAALDH